MVEVIQYLITKIKDLETENKDLLNKSIDYMNLVHENNKLKYMIEYILDELKAFDYYVSEEAKVGLIKYIEENIEGEENEEDTNINR